MKLEFSLPWPPTMNTYWRNIAIKGSPRTLISKKGREYRNKVIGKLILYGLDNEELQGRLSVHIKAYPPDKRKRDLDNLPKAVLDAITHGTLWADDSQIDDLRITREKIIKGGELMISIEPIEFVNGIRRAGL